MQIDNAINGINGKSTFKIIAFFILSFPTFQNYGQLQNILFALVTPNYTCKYDDSQHGWTVSRDHCVINRNGSSKNCEEWNFSSEPVGRTMVSDYNLVCDQRNYGDYIMILWYMTSLTAPLIGLLSDKYGRKNIALLCLLLETICSIMLALSSTVFVNMFWRVLLGVSSAGVTISYVWLMESVNVGFRNFIGSFFWMFGCIAYIISPFNNFLTKNWRQTQLISIIPSVLYLFIFYIPESPRWLLSSGRREEAFQSIKQIANFNGIKVPFKVEDIVSISDSKDGDLRSAFRSNVFLYRATMAVLLQFSNSLFYSAVAINLTILNKNLFVSMFLLGIMESPSLFLSYFSLRHMKRKTSIMSFGAIGSVLFLVSTFFSYDVRWQSFCRIIVGCIAKTAICCVNQTSSLFVIELFPTSHRSFGIICSQIFSFLSFTGAIYINKLSSSYFFLPMTIYLCFMCTSCLCAFYTLPETKGLPFPETLHDQAMLRVGREADFLRYMRDKYKIEWQLEAYGSEFVSDDSDVGRDHSLLTKRPKKGGREVLIV